MGIYIIRAKNGPVKIGFTDSDPHKRIANISTSHWAKLELVAFIEGSVKDEKSLHRRFSSARIRGEWFDVTEEIEAFIKSCPKPAKKPPTKFVDYDPEYVSTLRAVWFDMSIPSNNAAGKRSGVSYQLLRKNFGPSGREGRDMSKIQRQSAIASAAKRTGDGRCSPERLFELWGGPKDHKAVSSESGWPPATIYSHFKKLGITREMARLEMANRRKAKRKPKK